MWPLLPNLTQEVTSDMKFTDTLGAMSKSKIVKNVHLIVINVWAIKKELAYSGYKMAIPCTKPTISHFIPVKL